MIKSGLKKLPGEQGQALVEMALVLPLLLLLLFGIVEFGRVFNAYLIVTNAAREGARAGIVGAGDAKILETVEGSASALDTREMTVTISPSSANRVRGSALTVALDYSVTLYAPVISNIIGNPYVVHGSSTMRVE